METNLFINYYIDKDSDRQKELDECFIINAKNELIDKIIVFATEIEFDNCIDLLERKGIEKLRFVLCQKRPTFNDYFSIFKHYADSINIIANSDIIIDLNSILHIKSREFEKDTCLALTRYDIISGYWDSKDYSDAVFFNRPDSQDTWIFINCNFDKIEGADFCLGIAGCDNRIAYLMEKNKLFVINPSLTFQTFHLHLTTTRNYIDGLKIDSVPPPYSILIPCFIR